MITKDDYYKVAYLGIPGSYTWQAAMKYFKQNMNLISCFSINEVFQKVTKSDCMFGIIPLENSINGDIVENIDLIFKNKLTIEDEIPLKINHNLLGIEKIGINKIKLCYSNKQAILQCSHFFQKNSHIKTRFTTDTATAAKLVADTQQKEIVALASQVAAEKYSLKIIKKNIADDKNNTTRFLVFSNKNYEQIENLRKIINFLDKQLIEVLIRRFAVVKKIKKIKNRFGMPIFDLVRENEIIKNVRKLAGQYHLSEIFIEKIFKEIIKQSKKIQIKNR